jgi:hypothetical protein
MGDNKDFGDGLKYQITDHAPNPETRYAQAEEQRILRTAIQRLPPNLRVVVQIHLQGRSLDETAEVLGISLSAAKGRLFHAKKALRRWLIGKLVVKPRFAGKSCVLRPGLLVVADTRTRVHHQEQSSQRRKGDENVIEIQATSKRRIPSDFCPTGGAGQDLTSGFVAPRGNQNSSIRNLLERGGQPGQDLDDWLQAERELQPKVRSAHAANNS